MIQHGNQWTIYHLWYHANISLKTLLKNDPIPNVDEYIALLQKNSRWDIYHYNEDIVVSRICTFFVLAETMATIQCT